MNTQKADNSLENTIFFARNVYVDNNNVFNCLCAVSPNQSTLSITSKAKIQYMPTEKDENNLNNNKQTKGIQIKIK